MHRREFIESTVIATVFPFELGDDKKGYWGFDGVRDSGKIVFLRYDGEGKQCASCIVSGEVGSWEVRKAVWGGQIRHSDEYTDRAEALNHAVNWMQSN